MKPYFENEKNWIPAKAVIDSWMGTPYRHLWMKKGRGADCSLFIGAILQELGIVKKVSFTYYPPDWYIHSTVEVVREAFAKNIASEMAKGFDLQVLLPDVFGSKIPTMRGDIICFSMVPTTGVTNHAGILLDPPKTFVHSIQGRGVSLMDFGHFWSDKLTVVYRVVSYGL